MPIRGPGFVAVAGFSYDGDGKFRRTFALLTQNEQILLTG